MSRPAFLAALMADPAARARFIRWHLLLRARRARLSATATFRSRRAA